MPLFARWNPQPGCPSFSRSEARCRDATYSPRSYQPLFQGVMAHDVTMLSLLYAFTVLLSIAALSAGSPASFHPSSNLWGHPEVRAARLELLSTQQCARLGENSPECILYSAALAGRTSALERIGLGFVTLRSLPTTPAMSCYYRGGNMSPALLLLRVRCASVRSFLYPRQSNLLALTEVFVCSIRVSVTSAPIDRGRCSIRMPLSGPDTAHSGRASSGCSNIPETQRAG